MKKKCLHAKNAQEAITVIDNLLGDKEEKGLIDTTPVGPIKKGHYQSVILDNVDCGMCNAYRDTYWVCQECGEKFCYGCLIDSSDNLKKGEYKFKCPHCKSVRIFLKHNIHTTPMGFRF